MKGNGTKVFTREHGASEDDLLQLAAFRAEMNRWAEMRDAHWAPNVCYSNGLRI